MSELTLEGLLAVTEAIKAVKERRKLFYETRLCKDCYRMIQEIKNSFPFREEDVTLIVSVIIICEEFHSLLIKKGLPIGNYLVMKRTGGDQYFPIHDQCFKLFKAGEIYEI